MSPNEECPRTRLYIAQPIAAGADVFIEEKQAHYLINVLRQKNGSTVRVFNGHDGEWLAEIISVSKKNVVLSIKKQLRMQKPSPDLWLVAAPLRAGKSDFVIEKATELGISRFIPASTQFSVADRINESRLQSIAIEASEQCERMDIPVIEPLIPLQKLLSGWDKNRKIIYGDESGASKQVKELIPTLPLGNYAVLIGPEGGFSQVELELLRGLDYTLGVCMGPRILRADTAAIAALTLVQSWLGDWDYKPAFRN